MIILKLIKSSSLSTMTARNLSSLGVSLTTGFGLRPYKVQSTPTPVYILIV